MGAELVDQAKLAFTVPEGQKPFGQDLDPDRSAVRLRQLAFHQDRHPVATEQVAHGLTGTGVGEQLVLFLSHAILPDDRNRRHHRGKSVSAPL